jgi:hypothetical protein
MRRGAFLFFIVVAVLASAQPAAPETASRHLPRGLPRHFGIGLSATPDASGIYGWMPKTKIPFDYAYQYLAGGANTGNGWQTWNSNARFPVLYARGAHRHGYIPVSNPSQTCTRDGTSGKQRCSSHRSTVADDDGGYLRMAARDYYRSPVGLS